MQQLTIRTFETIGLGLLGGALFALLSLPLPWLLGAFLFTALIPGITKRPAHAPKVFRNTAFLMFGVYFSLYVSGEALLHIFPLLPVYLPLAALVIGMSLAAGSFLSKRLALRPAVSVLGLVPGAQSAVILVSDYLKENTSFIILLHSIRKVMVLISLPFIILLFAQESAGSMEASALKSENPEGTYFWYLLPAAAALLAFAHRSLLFAAPPAVMVLLILSGVEPAPFPAFAEAAAQLMLGIYLGSKLYLRDLKAAGGYGIIFAAAALFILILSTLSGILLAALTPLSTVTAVMSLAPGGLLEMGVIASESGGDPSIVITLQFIRFLFVFYALPPLLKWYLSRE